MSRSTLRFLAGLSALAVVVNALLLFLVELSDSVAGAWAEDRISVAAVGLAVAFLLVLQIVAAFKLLAGAPDAPAKGKKLAQIQWVIALAVLLVGSIFWGEPPMVLVAAFSSWGSAWYGTGNFLGGGGFPSLIPAFLLCQLLLCVRLVKPQRARRDLWSAAAAGAISYCGILGAFVVLPPFGTDKANPFEGGGATFFAVGTTLHFLAVVLLLTRSKVDAAMASLVGFGCLVSGLILTSGSSGVVIMRDKETEAEVIGGLLYTGWYELAPYMPILAYALTAAASVMLWLLPREVPASPDAVERDNSDRGPLRAILASRV